jgi:hypothetical protein
LTVSIGDFWRFAYQRVASKKDYEAIRREIRARLPGKPRDFAVRFEFDPEEVDQTLMRIVKSIRPPRLRGEEWSKGQVLSLQFEALEDLKKSALPSLCNAKRGWVSYLRQSVRNFYKDGIRKIQRLNIPLSQLAHQDLLSDADLADQDLLSELDFQNWQESKDWGKSTLADPNNTPLSQSADQDLQDSDLTELAKRLDPEQLLIFKEYLKELKERNKPAKPPASPRR